MLAFGLTDIPYVFMVIFGVGFLILIHEFGHFIAAKMAGVRVDAFSIGFGTRLFGWRRGDTEYRVGLIPLGGYVKMYGEVAGEGDPEDPRSLASKSIAWRFLIFSGGVLMNLLFALVAFPLVFWVGVPFTAPEVGGVIPGQPAWEVGLQQGDRILEINGKEMYSFQLLFQEAALSGDEGLILEVKRGDAAPFKVQVHPRDDDGIGIKRLGIKQPTLAQLAIRLEPGDSPARRAGLLHGDIVMYLMGVTDPNKIDRWWQKEIRAKGHTWFDSSDKNAKRGNRALELSVLRDGKTLEFSIVPERKLERERKLVGISAPMTKLLGIRKALSSEVDLLIDGMKLKPGNLLLGLVSKDDAGQDHFRLLLGGEDLALALSNAKGALRLRIRRSSSNMDYSSALFADIPIPARFLTKDGAKQFIDALAFGIDDISGRVLVQKGRPAWKIGLRDGDRILQLGGEDVRGWPEIHTRIRDSNGKELSIRFEHVSEGKSLAKSGTIQAAQSPMPWFGFFPGRELKKQTYAVPSFLGSLGAGFACSIDTIRQLYVTLKRIAGGSVSGKNVGGIITISVVTFETARSGWARFFFFLGILSLNLAFINVLPIPVLDGGHLMFLLIEMVKGSPVSERVMTYSQFVGLAMILSLMLYVTYQDILRWFVG